MGAIRVSSGFDSCGIPGYTSGMNDPQTILIREEPIELCQLLKFAGLAGTGGEAKLLITQELVSVNGEVETRKRRKIVSGDTVAFGDQRIVVAVR
jgi:ribosome-associated protein